MSDVGTREVARLSRREFGRLAGAALAWPTITSLARTDEPPVKTPIGIASSSYANRLRLGRGRGLDDPSAVLEFCRDRGAAGIQWPLGVRDGSEAARIRERADALGLYVEGSLRPPKDESDVGRFEAEARTAKDSGARVVRTVMQGGRRYEAFGRAESFREFLDWAWRSLRLAEPVVRRHGVVLAVENHKDYRADELADVLRRLDSEHVGACLDTGNNLALLEEPDETVRTLAPWVRSCHLKDMGVEEYREGFLLSEVILGRGFLDLAGIVGRLRSAYPPLRISLEMITRDPLKIPCLAEGYWATFPDLPGRELARTLDQVREHASGPLPRTTGRAEAELLDLEDANVRACLEFAREHLA